MGRRHECISSRGRSPVPDWGRRSLLYPFYFRFPDLDGARATGPDRDAAKLANPADLGPAVRLRGGNTDLAGCLRTLAGGLAAGEEILRLSDVVSGDDRLPQRPPGALAGGRLGGGCSTLGRVEPVPVHREI